jgi:hypothetical protein
MATTPNLGYGQQSEQTIDTVNQWMRASDWYNTLIHSFGQDPRNVHLNDQQKQQVMRAAQAQGVVVDEGNMEIDPSGNFNPIGHKLRNTLIVAGLAAATIATMGAAGVFSGAAGGGAAGSSAAGGVLEGTAAGAGGSTAIAAGIPAGVGAVEGGAYGLGDAALASMGGAAGTGVGTGAAVAGGGAGAWDAAGNFIGNSTYDIPADVAAAGGSRSYMDLLKYGLPVGGGIAGALIQANASGNASAAQQKYLEDALAYEKENDLYNRGVAADTLAYNRAASEAKIALEAGRYADYSGRITPFVQNATSSNDRMSALLGLPARSGATSGGASGGGGSSYSSYGTQTPQGVAVSPELTQRVIDNYKALGLTPTGAGSGPTDTAYFAEKYAQTGGSNPGNDAYWFGPGGRIAKEATQAGLKFGAPTTTTPPAATSPTPSQTGPTPGPLPIQPKSPAPASSLVTVRWPDGSTLSVTPDQVDQYRRGGATVVGA